jgi:lysyl-tRNA synthetase, class I
MELVIISEEENILHWASIISQEAIEKFGNKQVVAAGWSPSGNFHIGNARESITCTAFLRQLKFLKADCKFIFVIDDFDSLDKIPAVLKEFGKELKDYLGHPLNRIPDPTGQTSSYAELFAKDLKKTCADFDMDVEFRYASEMYKEGRYDKFLEIYHENEEKLQKLIESVSGSVLDSLIHVNCQNCGNQKTTEIIDMKDLENIRYTCNDKERYKGCGQEKSINYRDHGWKLKWRLDWPARQSFLNVTLEPAGKDHSVEGGSIDSSLKIHEIIFQRIPPIMPRYGFITLKGRKFSGSSGLGMPAVKIVDLIDPAAFLFLVYRSDLRKDINFSFETAQYGELIDEFTTARRVLNNKEAVGAARHLEKLATAARLALKPEQQKMIPSNVKFSELLLIYQTSLRDKDLTIEKLKKLSKFNDDDDLKELEFRIKRMSYWLDNLAADNFKFQLLDQPPANIKEFWSDDLKEVWLDVLREMDKIDDKDALMTILREKGKENNLTGGELFKPFYQLLLGKNVGPNATQLALSIGKERLEKLINQI